MPASISRIVKCFTGSDGFEKALLDSFVERVCVYKDGGYP